jgi:hypothetical protein
VLDVDAGREALWKQVVNRWDDPATHGAFLQYCQRTGALSEAAARYRGMSGDHARGEEARRRLAGVVILATQALEVTRSPARRGAPTWLTVLIGALCLLLVSYTLRRMLG